MNWQPVTSEVLQKIMLLNVFINDLDDEIECTITNFVANTTVGEIDKPEGRNTTQRHPDRLKD